MSLEKYTTLHKYAQRLAEDDLTEDQDEAATVAYAVGQVAQSIGSTIQAAAMRVHRSDNPEAVTMFHAGVSHFAEQLGNMVDEVAVMVAPFADLTDEPMSGPMKEEAHMLDDGVHITVLKEAQEFTAEYLFKEAK